MDCSQEEAHSSNSHSRGLGIRFDGIDGLPLSKASQLRNSLLDVTSDKQSNNLPVHMRSRKGMEGLTEAENGGFMVQLDPLGGGSGFKQGHHISSALPTLISANERASGIRISDRRDKGNDHIKMSMISHCNRLLLCSGAFRSTHKRVLRAERNARRIYNLSDDSFSTVAAWKFRVELVLNSKVFVEGGTFNGFLAFRTSSKAHLNATSIIYQEIRIIGFEHIPSIRQHHIFYNKVAAFRKLQNARNSTDSDVFRLSPPGRHQLHFEASIPLSGPGGLTRPKGVFLTQKEAQVRYAVVATIHIYDNAKKTCHAMYLSQDCEVWPLLPFDVTLSVPGHSTSASASKRLLLGGEGQMRLVAKMERPVWIAGQRCQVDIWIQNATRLKMKSLKLVILRTVTLFHPEPGLVPDTDSKSVYWDDPDACRTETLEKSISECHCDSPASRGLFTDEGCNFNTRESILIPADSCSIPRDRLLEVRHTLKVVAITNSVGADVMVELPISVVNIISLDAPSPFHSVSERQSGFV